MTSRSSYGHVVSRGRRVARFAVVLGVALGIPLTFAAQAQAAPTVVALWHMNEPAGSTVMQDAVGSNDSSTLQNVTLGVAGWSGTAYRFNGNSKVIVPSATALNPGSSTFTVKAHVLFSTTPPPSVGDYDLVRKGFSSTSGGDWKMEILAGGHASCFFKGSSGSATVTQTSRNLADSRWHTVSCKKTSSSLTLVVDGVSQSANVTIGTISNTVALNIGFKNDPNNPPQDWYTGKMDEVSISKG